jgi:putative addiction module component (TIGR02574 family)
MSPTVEQLKTTLRNLPSDDRAELADYLLQTLSGETADIKSEWLAVAQQRIADIRAGKITGIPAEEVLQDLLESKP